MELKIYLMSNKNNIMFDTRYLKTNHLFHLVDPSPWPLVAALGAFMFTAGTVLYMHKILGGWTLLTNGFLLILYVMFVWWRDVVREATYEEHHSFVVQRGLRLGMVLFIVSEIMFFFAFFWAFFHSSLNPVHNIAIWPPKLILEVYLKHIPSTNTVLLISSGATVTCSHHAIALKDKRKTLIALLITLILAIFFTYFQVREYATAFYNISDGIFGSCFYMLTGFHGFHVFVGTIALTVSFIRVVLNHFTNTHHFGFESAIWYWHFVDVVWLLLFVIVYWWGGLRADDILVIFYN